MQMRGHAGPMGSGHARPLTREGAPHDGRALHLSSEGRQVTAYIEHTAPDKDEEPKHYQISGDDMVDKLGLSGGAIVARSNKDFASVMSTFVQAVTLQFIIIYLLALEVHHYSIKARGMTGTHSTMTVLHKLFLLSAVHLHFITTCGQMPFAWIMLVNLGTFQQTWGKFIIAAPLVVIDGFITPLCQLVVGALFMCTAADEVNVLFCACAVAFISNIDNWIITLCGVVTELKGGELTDCHIHVPFHPKFAASMDWLVTKIPVFPWILSASLIYWGVCVMELGPRE